MPTTESKLLDQQAVEEIAEHVRAGSLLLPLRIEGWHKSPTDGGWFIRNPSGRVVMTIEFVEAEKYLGKPALDGNAPARATVALLNAIPALCATVKHLWEQNTRLTNGQHDLAGTLERIATSIGMSWCCTAETMELESQVKHLRAENERAITVLMKAHNDAVDELQSRLAQVESERDAAIRDAAVARGKL